MHEDKRSTGNVNYIKETPYWNKKMGARTAIHKGKQKTQDKDMCTKGDYFFFVGKQRVKGLTIKKQQKIMSLPQANKNQNTSTNYKTRKSE